MSAESSSPESAVCTVTIDCTSTNVKLHVVAPNIADNTALSEGTSHKFASAVKKAGDDKLSLHGSFIGDATNMPTSIDQQLQDALGVAGIEPQWRETIHRYGTAQYAKIRTQEQFRQVIEQRNSHGHDHVDAPQPSGPSSTGSRNTGSRTGHSGLTRRSGDR